MGLRVDFSELVRFKEKLEKADLSGVVNDTLNYASRTIIRSAVKNTPVGVYTNGKIGGTLRKGWHSKKEGANSRTVYNDVDYAEYVEYGHRIMGGEGRSEQVGWQEGRFMLTKAESEAEPKVARYAKKKLEDLLK